MEVAGLRAEVARMLATWVKDPGYLRERCEAVEATCAWLCGERVLSPASEAPMDPDVAGVDTEWMRAADLEREAIEQHQDGTWPGVVAETLRWFVCDPGVDSPV